jgi:hypothetical protein
MAKAEAAAGFPRKATGAQGVVFRQQQMQVPIATAQLK